MGLTNTGQTIKRPLVKAGQLLHTSISFCLFHMYFDDGGLVENGLRQGLREHAECWTGDTLDRSAAAVHICLLPAMGSDCTSIDRSNALLNRLMEYFENPTPERVFSGSDGKIKRVTLL